jgi:hypothetical protein
LHARGVAIDEIIATIRRDNERKRKKQFQPTPSNSLRRIFFEKESEKRVFF